MRKTVASMMAITLLAAATISCAAQHDMVVDNSTAATVRADINSALSALATNSSGATEPATKYAYQWWADTTSGYMKLRNAANNGWITTYTLANGPLPHTGAATITTLGTITSGTWNAGPIVTSVTNGFSIIGTATGNSFAGLYGVGSSGATGVLARGVDAPAADIGHTNQLDAASSANILKITRTAYSIYARTGDLISINDTPTGAGTVSGSLLKATVDSTERINFNPRVTDGASAKAYFFDTKNALSTAGAELLAVSNNGTEQFAVAHNGALKLKTGSNKSIGQATLVAGTVTVANTAITANSRIFVTVSTTGGTRGHLSVTKSAGVSFTITSSSGTDTSVVDYHIIESMP